MGRHTANFAISLSVQQQSLRCSFPQLPTTWAHRYSLPQLPTFDIYQGFMTLGDAGCCGLLRPLAAACGRFADGRRRHLKNSLLFLAWTTGTLKLVLKLFLLGGKLIGVCWLEIRFIFSLVNLRKRSRPRASLATELSRVLGARSLSEFQSKLNQKLSALGPKFQPM